jgi:uncharacterized protein (TIGR03067 family)
MLKFGEARAPHCLVDVNDQWVGADPALIRRIPFRGLIGDNILTPNQALIDIANAELYLRRPGAAPADVTDEVAAYFKAERYVQVPCTKPKNGVPYVRCTIGGHELSFILDTGAWSVMVDHAAGERIGFKGAPLPTGKGPFTPPGGKAMTFGPLPAPLLLPGGLELQAHNTLIGCDLSALNRGLAQLNLPRADGLLGVNVLQLFSAVIDYARPEPRLFLIDPFVRDGRLLDGEWAGEAAEVSGKPVPAEEVKNYRLTIWGDGFDLRLGTGRRLDLEIDLMGPNPGLRTLDLLSKGPGEKRAYPAIYEVSHGRLRVCLPLEVKPGEKVEEPKAFKSAPDSPYAVLTFRRVRAK